jgi:hypothetical protein
MLHFTDSKIKGELSCAFSQICAIGIWGQFFEIQLKAQIKRISSYI